MVIKKATRTLQATLKKNFTQRALIFTYAITFSQMQTGISINYCSALVFIHLAGNINHYIKQKCHVLH